MIQKIKRLVLVLVAGSTLMAPAIVPAFAGVAAADAIGDSLCNGVNDTGGGGANSSCTSTTGSGTSGLAKIAKSAITMFSYIVGVVSVLMIVYAGFRYITSGGESGKVGGAKNALIYAIIGLVIVGLSQVIVHYVLSTANSAVN